MFYPFQRVFQASFYFYQVQLLKPRRSLFFFIFSSTIGLDSASATFLYHCCYLFGSCNSHTDLYHYTSSMGNSLGNIPPADTSAGLCFIFMYWNATSVSLMISVIRFLTETDVLSLFLIFCQTYWESAHNILTAISVGQYQTGSISYKFW